MPTITYYRQTRQDGGVRSGVEVDGETLLARFDAGDADSDPALLWYVDMDCSGDRLPSQADAVRRWLLENRGKLADALRTLADRLRAGVDIDSWPVHWTATDPPAGAAVEVSCSAVRRVDTRELASVLGGIAEHWADRVAELSEAQPV